MFMKSILARTLYDKRWFALGWSFALSGMAVLMITMYPSLHDGMKSIAATMPPQLQGLVGDISMFGHLDTYLSSQLYDCLLYTSPSPRDGLLSRMPSSA